MPIEYQLNDSDTLVIAFAGFGRKMGVPNREFFEGADLNQYSRILVLDEERLKLLNGMPPDFDSLQEVLDHFREIIERHGFRRVWTTGISGGGHTCMLFGHLLKVDRVVAFAPYPYLSEERFAERDDPGWKAWERALKKYQQLPNEVIKYLDLEDVLCDWNGKTQYDVHVSRFNVWDYKRASCLKGLPGVRLIYHAQTKHSQTGSMLRRGTLKYCYRFPYRHPKRISEWIKWIKLSLKKPKDDLAGRYE